MDGKERIGSCCGENQALTMPGRPSYKRDKLMESIELPVRELRMIGYDFAEDYLT